VWPDPRGLKFYIVIFREMLKKSSSQETIGQFQPNLVGNMLGKWGFRFVQIQGPNKGQNKENFDKYSKIFFS